MNGISAVIATINRKDQLKRLFDSFVSNHFDNLELIVVDQNTNHLIDDLILEYSRILDIKHLKLTEANQSKARNHGATYATYPIICFPDDDCWFDDNALSDASKYFEKSTNIDLLIINWKQNPKKCKTSFNLTKNDVHTFKAQISYNTYVLFFNKEAFFKIGCFIEDIGLGLYIGAGEDTEIIFRAAKNNLIMFFASEIFVNHNYTPDYYRSLSATRSRQRASGFIYSKYDISNFVILRGLVSPLFRMIFSMNLKKFRTHYNTFLARIEGLRYGLKN